MKQTILLAAVTVIALGSAAVLAQDQEPQPALGFFVTSAMHSGNLGGLAGADAECQRLAAAVGAAGRTWRAYLSTQGTPSQPAVHARDRIGNGPWYNANGVLMVAGSLADLHGDIQRDSNLINQDTAVTEKGDPGERPGTPRREQQRTRHPDRIGFAWPRLSPGPVFSSRRPHLQQLDLGQLRRRRDDRASRPPEPMEYFVELVAHDGRMFAGRLQVDRRRRTVLLLCCRMTPCNPLQQ